MQDKGVSCIRKISKKYCGDETRSFMFLWLSVYKALPAVWRLCVLCVWAHECVSPRVPSGSLPIHSCLSSSCDWPCLPPSFKTFQWLIKKNRLQWCTLIPKTKIFQVTVRLHVRSPCLGPSPTFNHNRGELPGSSHTGLLSCPWAPSAPSCLGAFAPAIPSAWAALLTSFCPFST